MPITEEHNALLRNLFNAAMSVASPHLASLTAHEEAKTIP